MRKKLLSEVKVEKTAAGKQYNLCNVKTVAEL